MESLSKSNVDGVTSSSRKPTGPRRSQSTSAATQHGPGDATASGAADQVVPATGTATETPAQSNHSARHSASEKWIPGSKNLSMQLPAAGDKSAATSRRKAAGGNATVPVARR